MKAAFNIYYIRTYIITSFCALFVQFENYKAATIVIMWLLLSSDGVVGSLCGTLRVAVLAVSHIFVAVNMAPFMTSGATMERKAAL